MEWFFYREIRVAPGTIDVGNRVANAASNSSVRCRMVDVVKVRVVKLSAEKWNWVMATGAEPRSFHVTITLLGKVASFPHAHQICRIVE